MVVSCSNMETVCTFQFLPLLILPFAVSDWKSSICQHVVPHLAFGQLEYIADAKCCSLSGVIIDTFFSRLLRGYRNVVGT